MNMPHAEFICGMPQLSHPNWREPYSRKVFIFERHRLHEPGRDLGYLIARWLKKKQHTPQAGYVHRVQFPEQPAMEMLAWTTHRAFQAVVPTDVHRAPEHVLLFTHDRALLQWKRDYWERRGLLPNHPFIVHTTCFDPSGQRMRGKLLTFDG